MADRIKGLTIVLGADSSELTKAIYSVNTAIKNTQANLRDINRALKFDPKNTELLKDKQNELTRAIEDTKTKIAEEERALQALKDAGVDETSQEFRDLKTQIDLDKSALKGFEDQMKSFGSVGSQVMQAVGKEIKAVGDSMQQVGNKIADVGSTLTTRVTVPIVAAGTAMVSKYAEVDKTMNLTNQTMGNTTEQAKILNDAMEQAAANSVFGMNDAAQASLNFARAGLTAEQAASALAPAMNLAAGEAGDLNTVSGGLVATINGFGDDFDQASRYANVFASACNNSALDVNSLSQSMSVAAPIFNAAGKEVEDAATMLGVMANAGIDANTAANSLKTGMSRLAEPTKGAKEAMEKYGIAMEDIWNPDGSLKDMTVVQENLHNAFAKLSEQEQMAAAGAIFGKQQMSAWLAVVNTAPEDVEKLAVNIAGANLDLNDFSKNLEANGLSMDEMKKNMAALGVSSEDFDYFLKISGGDAKDFAEGLNEATNAGVSMDDVIEALGGNLDTIQTAMDNTKGTTEAMSEAMMGGFGGSIEKLKSSIDVLMTSLGGLIAEYLTPVIEKIQGVVDAFMALDDETKQHIIQIAGIIAAVGPILLIVGKVIVGIGSLISAVGTITTAIGAAIPIITGIGTLITGTIIPALVSVLVPILPIVVAIAAVTAAIIECVKHWDEIKEAAGIVADYLSEKWTKFKEDFRALWDEIWQNVNELVDKIGNSITTTFNKAVTGALNYFNNLKNNAINIFKNILSGISGIVNSISSTIVNGFNNAVNYITSLPSRALGWGRDIINGVISGIRNAIGGLVSAMSDVANTIASFIHFSEPDEGPLSNFHTFMPDMMKQIAQGIHNGIPEVKNAMDSMAQTMVPSMQGLNGSGSAGATTNNNTSNSISLNIYGAQGQDVNELADIIEQKITDNVVRRGVAFG